MLLYLLHTEEIEAVSPTAAQAPRWLLQMGSQVGNTPDAARDLHFLSNTVPPQTLSIARLSGPPLQARQKNEEIPFAALFPSLVCSGLSLLPALPPGPS